MGGFEEELRRVVAADADACRQRRRHLDAEAEHRARLRAENEAAVREFIATKAAAREPGLHTLTVRSRHGIGRWHRRHALTGWPVSVPDGNGGAVEYFVRTDGRVFSVVRPDEPDADVRTVLEPEEADLGVRPLAPGLAAAGR